ncbi:MAG: nucleotide sugar dehydrogenase [Jatrophihabitantaceae bacterium]
MSEQLNVAVVGLGYVGSCIAATLADRGANVIGVDTDSRLIEELHRGYSRFREQELEEILVRSMAAGTLTVTTDPAAITSSDVVLITVGTPVREDGALADEQLRSACLSLSKHIRAGQLLVLKSTVPPGTTRDFVMPLLEESGLVGGVDFQLAFAPERLAEGAALAELRTFPIVVGGLDEASTRAAGQFWRQALGVPVMEQDSLEAAEIVKLADNWWIDLNIALANELAKYCALFDVDVLDVITAANSIPKGNGNINILLPSIGVGGSCLTKDPWMVWQSAKRKGLDILTAPAGREVNAAMPNYTVQLILDELAAHSIDPGQATIAVLGLAFKNNTGDLRATPTVGVVTGLAKAGAQLRLHDPLVDLDHAEELFGLRPLATVAEAVDGADCIAILAMHRDFDDIDLAGLPVAAGCLILDGRAYLAKDRIVELREQGLRYRGIGR